MFLSRFYYTRKNARFKQIVQHRSLQNLLRQTGLIVPFLLVIWSVGFLITMLHELAHIAVLHEKPQSMSIGIPVVIKIKYQRFILYPLFPFCGSVEMSLLKQPSRFRMACFTIAGCLAGLLSSILCGYFGYLLLPTEALSEFHKNGHRLGFLLRDVCAGTSDLQTTFATALIISAIGFGIQQLANLAPIPNYDGFNFFRVLFHRFNKE